MTKPPEPIGMTDEEIIEAVARKVMGWKLKRCSCTGDMLWVSGWTQKLESEYGDICKIPFAKGFAVHHNCNFLTDWNATMQVLEKAMQRGAFRNVQFTTPWLSDLGPQRAICLACLQAADSSTH